MKWRLVGFDIKGVFNDINADDYSNAVLGRIEFTIPDMEISQKTKILMELCDEKGNVFSENFQEIRIFPAGYKKTVKEISIYLDKSLSSLRNSLTAGGFEVLENFGYDVECAVSADITPEIEEYLERNGNLLLLKAKDIEIERDIPIKFVSRNVDGRWGDWCSTFIWLKKDKMFQKIHPDNHLGFSFYNVTPEEVIIGYESDDNKDCISGIFRGWLNVPAVLIGQFGYKNGKVLASTFNVSKDYQKDPVATIMLNDMIEYVCSDNFKPEFNIK